MKTMRIIGAGAIMLLLCLSNSSPSAPGCAPGAAYAADGSMAITRKAALHDAMRKLWEEHVAWTRLYIVSAAAELPDAQKVADHLMLNQSDIGDAIKPYYGDAAGNSLSALLKDHISIAADVVAAAKADDAAKLAAASKRWNDNADSIATFLNAANPVYWQEPDIRRMLHEHLSLTTDEVKARLAGDWTSDIAAYERAREQALSMADALSAGIISQFPEKF